MVRQAPSPRNRPSKRKLIPPPISPPPTHPLTPHFQSGGGVGAVILSLIAQASINSLSIPWTLRILGILALAFGIISTSLMKQRVTVKKISYKLIDPSVLRMKGYPLYLIFAFIQIFGFITPLFFIPSESPPRSTSFFLDPKSNSPPPSQATAQQSASPPPKHPPS